MPTAFEMGPLTHLMARVKARFAERVENKEISDKVSLNAVTIGKGASNAQGVIKLFYNDRRGVIKLFYNDRRDEDRHESEILAVPFEMLIEASDVKNKGVHEVAESALDAFHEHLMEALKAAKTSAPTEKDQGSPQEDPGDAQSNEGS